MGLLLGVDGGNTKTVALVADREGTVLGAGRGGCADVYGAASPEAAYSAITGAVHAALAEASARAADLDAAVYSLAGADWPEDLERYGRELRTRIGGPVTIVNDAIGAIRAGTPDGVGASVVCGTGTAIGAQAPGGGRFHVSFWGAPGYVYDPSRSALEAAIRSELGVEPPSLLPRLVARAMGGDGMEEVLRRLTLLESARPSAGPAGGALLDAADAGDALARRVLSTVVGHIADYVRVSARRAGLPAPTPLVLAGGLFRHRSAALRDGLAAALPESALRLARFEPAMGALLLAFDEAGLRADAARLEASAPPASLYASA